MNRIKKLIKIYDYIEEIILIIMLSITVIIIFYQIVMRYIFNNSPTWTEELARYLFIWGSWVGVSIGAKYGKHIEITMLTDKLSKKGNALCRILSNAIVIVICLLITQQGTVLTEKMFNIGASSAAMQIPMGFVYLAIPVGCGLMALRNFEGIYNAIKILNGSREKVEGGEI